MADSNFSFDSVDYKILCILHDDARIPTSTIAKQLNLDARTVKQRISRLLDSGAVRTSVLIDPSRFGYPCIVEMYVEVETPYMEEYTKKFMDDSRIPYLAVQWEKNQLELQARFRTNEEMYYFINFELSSLPGIKILSRHLVPMILKNIDSWFPGEPDFD